MRISVSDAKAQLTALVRRAESGDEVILTRNGRAVVRLSPVTPVVDARGRKAIVDAVRASALSKISEGMHAASSADFLYDDDGLPR